MKWQNLKNFINTLTPEQLEKEIYLDNGYTDRFYTVEAIAIVSERAVESSTGIFFESEYPEYVDKLWASNHVIKIDKGDFLIKID